MRKVKNCQNVPFATSKSHFNKTQLSYLSLHWAKGIILKQSNGPLTSTSMHQLEWENQKEQWVWVDTELRSWVQDKVEAEQKSTPTLPWS